MESDAMSGNGEAFGNEAVKILVRDVSARSSPNAIPIEKDLQIE